MSRDETYLESFIDHVATLPNEIRRNLELMKDMDKSCSQLFEEMTRQQQEYVQRVEEKMNKLEVVDGKALRVLGTGPDGPAIIPTTEELLQYINQIDDNNNKKKKKEKEKKSKGDGENDNDNEEEEEDNDGDDDHDDNNNHDDASYYDPPKKLQKIEKLQEDCIQRAEEKVAIANQTFSLVDNICKRLESDVNALEKLLQSTGEFQAPGSAKPNDLAAIQVIPGSPDWILAKVIKHDVRTGMYELADEDTESNKIFTLPEPQVVILNGIKKLSRGDIVFAVYPDTTSFYQATVVQAPRKVSGGGSFVMVHFVDDSDEHGITHDKAVLMNHVMRPPQGVTLQ